MTTEEQVYRAYGIKPTYIFKDSKDIKFCTKFRTLEEAIDFAGEEERHLIEKVYPPITAEMREQLIDLLAIHFHINIFSNSNIYNFTIERWSDDEDVDYYEIEGKGTLLEYALYNILINKEVVENKKFHKAVREVLNGN